jgi:hypothetical protein
MSIITRMRRQDAIYWPPGEPDDYGHCSFGELVELVQVGGVNYRVRWEDRVEEFIDAAGTLTRSRAVVFVPVLPSGGEIVVGGYLLLGPRGSLVSEIEPQRNVGACEVRRVDYLPNLKNTERLRTVYL